MPAPSSFEIVDVGDTEGAAKVFHRDGLVAVSGALSAGQLAIARSGADRVIAEQTAATPLEAANRGFARYSFGPQHQHPEWTQLLELPALLAIREAIWGSRDFHCSGAGGDYSLPGARIQKLHSDIGDVLADPEGRATIFDLPSPFVVINFPLVDFTRQNGATRFVPCTQRSRHRPPDLEEEPAWMRESILRAPAGSAVIRDVRCWHGGTANDSGQIRAMTSVGYYAPWFRRPRGSETFLPRARYEELGERGRELCRGLLDPDGATP